MRSICINVLLSLAPRRIALRSTAITSVFDPCTVAAAVASGGKAVITGTNLSASIRR